MPPEFRYSLTRICLRTGQLSLSQRMAEIFPDSGKVRVLDTVDDREFEFVMDEPRRVSGVAEYLRRHQLEVNDSIQVRQLTDGRIALTAMPRHTHRQFDEQAAADLLDSLVGDKPRTEAEIRALHPLIPADYPLAQQLDAHPRLQLRGGRWVGVEVAEEGSAPASKKQDPEPHRSAESRAQADSIQDHERHRSAESGAQADSVQDHESDLSAELGAQAGIVRERRGRRASETPAAADEEEGARTGRETRRSRDRSRTGRPAAVTPYPRGVMFPGEAALNSKRPAADLKLVNRAREALTGFGYRVEGLPNAMLLARADLGRRQHSVLVRVLADGERLDWAALLARRREQTAEHLAVFGDHRDLHRLTAPAELARATLWSWDGIARVQNLAQTILVGPFDLEAHFVKGGMFGPGLQQFERSVGRMISEKGSLSAVITRLALLRAPAVFVLDDLVEGDLQREQVAKALDLLAQAPFHLVAKVDRGEYCLRHPVAESLAHLSEYALSLGERLPGARGRRRHARVDGAVPDEQVDRSTAYSELELADET